MAKPDSDEVLMQRVQGGEFALFEELVQRYRTPLLRVATSKLQDDTLAEDVVQEALLAAFAARQTFNPRYSFRTWLWTITLRLCYRQTQRRRAGRPPLADAGQTLQLIAPDSGALERMLQTERSSLLLQSLNELPEPQADALRLRFFGELSFEEIAAAMQSSVSGAKQRVKLGLERLAVRLKSLSGVES